MAKETDTEEVQQEVETTEETAENTGEDQTPASPTGKGNEDVIARLTAMEAQLQREREKNEQLENSVRIQERYWQQQQERTTTPAKEEPKLSDDLDVLDKALEPLLSRRFKSQVDPLNARYGALAEDNDALRFEMFIQRNNPELMENEDEYNKTMQRVEAIRQAARQRGMQVSRVDAFVFDTGLQGTRQRITDRKQKKTSAVTQETKRQAEVKAANATSTTGEPRQSANVGIQAIREKANRGERLTDAERGKMRDYVSNVEL